MPSHTVCPKGRWPTHVLLVAWAPRRLGGRHGDHRNLGQPCSPGARPGSQPHRRQRALPGTPVHQDVWFLCTGPGGHPSMEVSPGNGSCGGGQHRVTVPTAECGRAPGGSCAGLACQDRCCRGSAGRARRMEVCSLKTSEQRGLENTPGLQPESQLAAYGTLSSPGWCRVGSHGRSGQGVASGAGLESILRPIK